jgi:pimeloyl-ACP methyl ester carboxylesterase
MGQHGTMTWWDPQLLSALAARFTVTIFDLPGVGYSQAIPDVATLDEYADATAGLVLALGLGTSGVAIVGWGLGGDVALDAEMRHPHLATSLTLVDTPAPGPLNVRRSATAAAFSSVDATTVGLSQSMFPATQNDVRTAWLQRIGQVSPDDITAKAVRDEASVASSIAHDVNLAHGLHAVDVPVHVVTGTVDAFVPEVNTIRLARSIPNASLLELADGGYAAIVAYQSQFVGVLSAPAN